MKNKEAIMKYDKEADVLSVENDANTPVSYAQEMGNLVVHFSRQNKPVLIEILDASKLFRKQPKSLKTTLHRVLVSA